MSLRRAPFRFGWRVAGVLCAVAVAAAAPIAAADERAPDYRSPAAAEDAGVARVIVKYREGGSLISSARAGERTTLRPQHAARLSQRLGLALADGRPIGSRMQALHARGLSSSELASRLAADAEVEFAVPSLRRHAHATLPNDPFFGAGQTTITPAVGQWYLRAPDSTAVSAINAVGAWSITTGSAAVVVADLDSGVRFEHPDLAGKLHPGYDFVSNAASAADGNGRDIDASDPGDWAAAGECGAGRPAVASSWHGTQVAGLIGAATDNGIGMASAGRDVTVLPVRVLGKCGIGFDDDIQAAMLWAAGLSSDPVVNLHPARVINLSLGAASACSAAYRSVLAQLAAAGVSVVASAGNDGMAVDSPANCPGVIAVGGVRHAGTKSGFSSLGPEVAISAPAGNCVNPSGSCLYPLLTTTNSGVTLPVASTYSNGTETSLGTSFSSPLVAGTAALMLSVNPSLTPAQVRAALQAGARAFPASGADPTVAACHAPTRTLQPECYCTTSTCGAGLLDASAAVAAVAAAGLPLARVVPAAASVVAGTPLALDGAPSRAAAGATIVSYRWAIATGTAIAELASPTDASTVTLLTRSPGDVAVVLTVTDNLGRQTAATATINVTTAASAGGGASASSGGGGGGGGALGGGWLGGLALAVLALATQRRRVSSMPG